MRHLGSPIFPTDLGQSALAYARRGKPVFPCGQDKEPFVPGGFKAASTDARQIKRWWAQWPDALIGMPTGEITGLVVLDIDHKNGKDGRVSLDTLIDAHVPLPDTQVSLTPTGGEHLYFAYPDRADIRCSAGKLGIGLDVRGNGGYVILPPSAIKGRRYEWEASNPERPAPIPMWLLDLMTKDQSPASAPSMPSGNVDPIRLIEALHALTYTNDMGRDHWLKIMMAFKAAGGTFEEFEPWCREQDGFEGDRMLKREWESVDSDGGITAGTLFHLAREARNGNKGDSSNEKPTIQIVPGMVPSICRALAKAFADGEAPIYRRSTILMRATRIAMAETIGEVRRARNALILMPVTAHSLMRDGATYATITRWNERKNTDVVVDLPERHAKAFIAAAPELTELAPIVGITEVPILRDDGTLITATGYDAETGLVFDSHGIDWATLRVPQRPTAEDIRNALALLWRPIQDFPFMDLVDRAVAISAIVSAVLRPLLPTAPLHGFTACAPGTGKTLLTNLIGVISSGRPVAAMAQGGSAQEFEKRVDAIILAADPVANIDNVSRPIQGDTACVNLTSSRVRIRPLGSSERLDVPSVTFWMATGNNLTFRGDMVRRALLCRMDAGEERPDLRDGFKIPDLLGWAADQRAALLSAIFTILRGHVVAGEPATGCKPLGSFESWCRRVRDPLVWAGAPDPVESSEFVRDEDPEAAERGAILQAWRALYGDEAVPVKDITAVAQRVQEKDSTATEKECALIDAFAAISPTGRYDARRTGYWLRANKGRIRNWLRLRAETAHTKINLWRVEDMKA